MKINTAKINETVTTVRLDEKQLKALLTAAVAEAASIELRAANVKVRRCFITSRNGSSGSEYEATIEIVEDHAPALSSTADWLEPEEGAPS